MDGYELAGGVLARPLLLLRGCRTLPAVLLQHDVINGLDAPNYSVPRFWMLVYVDDNAGNVVSIHDSAVGMIVTPGTRFTEDPDTFPSLQALYDFVLYRRVAEGFFHERHMLGVDEDAIHHPVRTPHLLETVSRKL